MVKYDYTSRTACLRNRIAISYHQNSKNECLPKGCLLGLCLSYHASSTPPKVVSFVPVVFVVLKTSSNKDQRSHSCDLKIRVPIKHTHPCSNQSLNNTHTCSLSKTSGTYIYNKV